MTTYDSTGTLQLGSLTALSLQIGRSGVTTTFASGSTISGLGTTATLGTLTLTAATGAAPVQTVNNTLSVGAGVHAGGARFLAPNMVVGEFLDTLFGKSATEAIQFYYTHQTLVSDRLATLQIQSATSGLSVLGTGGVLVPAIIASTSTVTGTLVLGGGVGVGGTVNAAVLAAAGGTTAAPSHTFTANADSGMYYSSTNATVELATGGQARQMLYRNKTGLTNNASNSLIRISGLTNSGATSRGGLKLTFFLEVADAANNNQALMGTAFFACEQTGGAVQATASSADAVAVGSGTLTATFSTVVSVSGQADLAIFPASSLTPTTLQVGFSVESLNTTSSLSITFL